MFYPELSPLFSAVLERLEGQPVAVCGHLRPDGDCIGSQVALTRMLLALGREAVAVNQHPPPRTMSDFVADTPFVQAEAFEPDGHKAVNVDCADAARIGVRLHEFFPVPVACIDHHLSNPGYAEINLVDAGSSATAELLAGFFFDNNLPVDPVTAQALYIGIATDTGQFRYRSTTRHTFEISGRLIDAGAEPAEAAHQLYERESSAKLKLLQYFLASLRYENDGRVCIGAIPNGVYEHFGAFIEDSEGIVDFARCVDGVEIGVLLEERGDVLKGSLRGKHDRVRLDRLAQRFSGGGHACAAGFSQTTDIASFYPVFVDAVTEHLDEVSPPHS